MDAIIRLTHMESSQYLDIHHIFKQLVEKQYVEKLVDIFQEIFVAEQQFTKAQLQKLLKSLPKEKQFNFTEQYAMNASIFQKNFEIINQILITNVWNSVENDLNKNTNSRDNKFGALDYRSAQQSPTNMQRFSMPNPNSIGNMSNFPQQSEESLLLLNKYMGGDGAAQQLLEVPLYMEMSQSDKAREQTAGPMNTEEKVKQTENFEQSAKKDKLNSSKDLMSNKQVRDSSMERVSKQFSQTLIGDQSIVSGNINFVSMSTSNIQDYYPISPQEAANWVRKNMEARKNSPSPKTLTNLTDEINSPLNRGQSGSLSSSFLAKSNANNLSLLQGKKDLEKKNDLSITSFQSSSMNQNNSMVIPFSEISMDQRSNLSFSRADRNLTNFSGLELSPGPADYNINNSQKHTRKNSPSANFGTSPKRSFIDQHLKNSTTSPGPQYDVSKVNLSQKLKTQK